MNEDYMKTIDKRFEKEISIIESEMSDDLNSDSELREFLEHKYLTLGLFIHIENEKLKRTINESKQKELRLKKIYRVLSDIESCLDIKANEVSTDELFSSIKRGREIIFVKFGEGAI